MKGKYKLTRLSRFIIFLALMTPLFYIAGPTILFDFINIKEIKEDFMRSYNSDSTDDEATYDLDEVEELKEDILDLKEEIEDIETEISEKELMLNEILENLKEV